MDSFLMLDTFICLLCNLIRANLAVNDELKLSKYRDSGNDAANIVINRYYANRSEISIGIFPTGEMVKENIERKLPKKKKHQNLREISDSKEDNDYEYEEQDPDLEAEFYKGIQCKHGARKTIGCQECYCIGGQIYICSLLNCPYVDEVPVAIARYNVVKLEYKHCNPRKWHPLTENTSCKQCVCVDGEQAFCYLNFCKTRFRSINDEKLHPLHGIATLSDRSFLSRPASSLLDGRNDLGIFLQLRSKNRKYSIKMKERTQRELGLRSVDKTIAVTNRTNLWPCKLNQYFSLGSDKACRACWCDENAEWICWHTKGPCASYYDKKGCHPGDTVKNLLTPCSLCYCGINGIYLCTTDENCAFHIRRLRNDIAKSNCDSIKCLNQCQKKNYYLGLCPKTGCTCLE